MNCKIELKDDNSLKHVLRVLGDVLELDKPKPHVVHIMPQSTARTVLQNACSHYWYSQVAKDEQEYTAAQVKFLCKLNIGLDILRGSDEEYNALCCKFIDGQTYEDKLEIMSFFPVTSRFSTKQFGEYLLGVRQNYAGRVDLRFRNEDKLY